MILFTSTISVPMPSRTLRCIVWVSVSVSFLIRAETIRLPRGTDQPYPASLESNSRSSAASDSASGRYF